MSSMQQLHRRFLGIRPRPLALAIGLGLVATVTSAEQWKPKKPTFPTIAIDNEGPIAIIQTVRTRPGGGQGGGEHGGDQNREAAPPNEIILPWRNVIRLDLILPIRTGPWTPPAPPKRRSR
jgi:hypothetical protein